MYFLNIFLDKRILYFYIKRTRRAKPIAKLGTESHGSLNGRKDSRVAWKMTMRLFWYGFEKTKRNYKVTKKLVSRRLL